MRTSISILTREARYRQHKIDRNKYGYSYAEKVKIEITQIDKAIKYLSNHIEEDFETCYFCKYYDRKNQFCQCNRTNITFINSDNKCKYFWK